MDDFKQKIATGNVFIQTQAVSTVYSRLLAHNDGDISKSPEVSILYQCVRSGSANAAGIAASALVALATSDKLSAVTLLTNLLADVVTATCPAPTVQAITQLMLHITKINWSTENDNQKNESKVTGEDSKHSFQKTNGLNSIEKKEGNSCELVNPFTGPPHGPVCPYVTLVRKRPGLAGAVVDECEYLLYHPDERVRGMSSSMIKPLLLYASCLSDGSTVVALLQPLLALLHQTHCNTDNGDVLAILLEAARLSRATDGNNNSVQCKVSVLCGVADIAVHDSNTALQHALLPALITALPSATLAGLPTRRLLRLIGCLVMNVAELGCDVSLAALTTTLPHVSSHALPDLLKMCGQLVCSVNSNPLVCCTLLPSVLQVLAAPCKQSPVLSKAAATLAALVQHKKKATSDLAIKGNPYWNTVSCAYPSLPCLVTMVETCNQLVAGGGDLSTTWLSTLAASGGGGLGRVNQLVVTAVFLYMASPPGAVMEAARTLEREVVKGRYSAVDLLPLLLYRLAHDRQPDTRITVLHLLPSLAASKLCVPLVLKTVLALYKTGTALRPVLLRLLLDIWRVEPRVYPHLQKIITEQEGNTGGRSKAAPIKRNGELCIAKAYVIATICKEKPSQHGEELLPVLSELLNYNSTASAVSYSTTSSSATLVSSAVCCLALSAITELISAGVIDLRTTWRVLAPQMAKDKRPDVICSLAKLLTLAAKLQVKSEEYDTFMNNILNILWSWTNHQNRSVVAAAYNALQDFNMALFTFKMLPSYARVGIKLPDSLAATPVEAARRPEDVLTYVPGEAWINLVKGAKSSLLPCLEQFVQSLVKREVGGLYKGIYLTALQEAKKRGLKGSGGKPEPLLYDFLKEYSTLRAIVLFLHLLPKQLDSCPKEEGDKLLTALLVLLKALGQPLNRPFPALDWIILSNVQDAAKSWCEKHAKIDWDEKIRHVIFDILSKQCNKSASASAYMCKFLVASTSNGLTQKDEIHLFGLMDYLGRGIPPATLQPFIAFTLNRYVSETRQLKLLLDSVKPVLTSEIIHDTNRNALGNSIESLNDKIDATNGSLYCSYKACVADLPAKHIERLTSPSLWWEVTDARLYSAAILRCHVAVNDPDEMALPWLNDIIDSAASLPGERTSLLKVLAETLTVRCSDTESSAWFVQLLGQLLDQTKKKIADNLVANHEHNQRILFYSDLLIICLIIWSNNYINYGIEAIVNTPPLCDRLINSSIDILFERRCWRESLPQLLNFLVSTLGYLDKFLGDRYRLHSCTLHMANRCSSVSQAMWNKVVALNVANNAK